MYRASIVKPMLVAKNSAAKMAVARVSALAWPRPVMKPAEESGSFFTRLAWYYQMGMLLLLSGLLIFAADYLLDQRPVGW